MPAEDNRVAAKGEPLFKKDDPTEIAVGDTRLDQYLRNARMDWVLRLREQVCGLDYSKFIEAYDGLGRRPFHPRAMVGLVVYGVLAGRSTLRELEALARLDAGAWWMTGGGQPDHSVIGRFLQKHSALLTDEFFLQVTQHVVTKMKLKPGVAGIDGTIVEAASSRFKALTAPKLDEQIAETSAGDMERQAKLVAARDIAAERTKVRNKHGRPGQSAVVVDEPEAVVQGLKNGLIAPSYKPVLMTTKEGVIVGQVVEPSNECKAVTPLMRQYVKVFDAVPTRLLMDAGFFSGEVLAELNEQNVDTLCPPGKAFDRASFERRTKGCFPKSAFKFDDEKATYRCPAGRLMILEGRDSDDVHRFKGAGCSECPLRSRCTSGKTRHVTREKNDDVRDAMRAVFTQRRARTAYRERPQIAETPFATLKNCQGFTRFRRRGRHGAALETAIQCMALNLGKCAHARFLLWLLLASKMANPATLTTFFARSIRARAGAGHRRRPT